MLAVTNTNHTLSQVCLVYASGELSVIEYGCNEVLAVCRTEHMSPYLLSVTVHEARGKSSEAKSVAYLVDMQTIRVLDLITGTTSATINHDAKLDWLVSMHAWLVGHVCIVKELPLAHIVNSHATCYERFPGLSM